MSGRVRLRGAFCRMRSSLLPRHKIQEPRLSRKQNKSGAAALLEIESVDQRSTYFERRVGFRPPVSCCIFIRSGVDGVPLVQGPKDTLLVCTDLMRILNFPKQEQI